MCGIFGYSGRHEPSEVLLAGLKRLEYRGYDSWGICYKIEGSKALQLQKEVGHIPELGVEHANGDKIRYGKGADLVHKSKRNYGIAHTRWATHGGVTQLNAHPHFSSDKSFALAQNGIVENYQELKAGLTAKNYRFESQTDTEVIVRLIEDELKRSNSDLFTAVLSAFKQLKGRNTIIVINSANSEIIAIRNGSPLVVGVSNPQILGTSKKAEDIEVFFGSDYLSFANFTNNILELADQEGVHLTSTALKKFSLAKTEVENLDLEFSSVSENWEVIDKAGYEDFMLKEINEQAQTILNASSYTEAELEPLLKAISAARHVYTVGCGTAAFAAGQIAYYLRKYASIDATELKGYEMESYANIFDNQDLLITISQSGETADTLEAVKLMQAKRGKIASIVNMLGSTLTKLSDYPYFSRTGPEICVASTKAFTAQIAWGYLVSLSLVGRFQEAKAELEKTATAIAQILESTQLQTNLEKVVNYLQDKQHAFVLGRNQNYYISLEAALKIKEISYKHFEGFAAGELKHGVIALVEPGTPVFAIVSKDESEADMLNAIAEVRTRGGKIIAVAPEANELYDYHLAVPELTHCSALANIIPFQLLSYYLGKRLGNNVDKPRNLAKSVTVK